MAERDGCYRVGIPGGSKGGDDFAGLANPLDDLVIEESSCDFSRFVAVQADKLVSFTQPGKLQTVFAERPRPSQDGWRLRVGDGRSIGYLKDGPAGGGSPLLIEAEAPADQRDGQAAVAQDGVVESSQREPPPAGRAEVLT